MQRFKTVFLECLTRLTGLGSRQPLLILSLPRSGSSWVGATLGGASDALYFREPIRAACTDQLGADWRTGVAVDPDNSGEQLTSVADAIFSGRPPSVRGVFAFRDAPLSVGRPIRLLVKEINLGATEFFVRRYRPKVIFLVRHPAPVTLSYKNIGWGTIARENTSDFTASADSASGENLSAIPSDFWQCQGQLQARALRSASDVLDGYDDVLRVKYEDVCENPLGKFREMAAFLGLNYSRRFESRIQKSDGAPLDDDPYSTVRPTRQMPMAWKEKVSSNDLEALQGAYLANDPPVYNTAADWV